MKAAIAASLLVVAGGCAVKTDGLGWPRGTGASPSSSSPSTSTSTSPSPSASGKPERVRDAKGSWPEGVPDYDSDEKVAGLRDMGGGVWWLNMPAAARKSPDHGCPELQFEDFDQWHQWSPYTEKTRVKGLPDVRGMTLEQALAAMTATDEQLCITLRTDSWDDCTTPAGAGHVCQASPDPEHELDYNGTVALWMQYDVRPDGELRLPDVEQRDTDDAVAELARRGFTSVTVTEGSVPCERGVVCVVNLRADRFYPADQAIELTVRKAKR